MTIQADNDLDAITLGVENLRSLGLSPDCMIDMAPAITRGMVVVVLRLSSIEYVIGSFEPTTPVSEALAYLRHGTPFSHPLVQHISKAPKPNG